MNIKHSILLGMTVVAMAGCAGSGGLSGPIFIIGYDSDADGDAEIVIANSDGSGATVFGQCSKVLPRDIFAARSEPLSKSVQIVSQDAKVVHTRFPVKRREI